MLLDTTTLPHASITNDTPGKKMTEHPYLWKDGGEVEESGLDMRHITVEGICTTLTERDAIQQICESSGVKNLYFPSIIGASDDRYYKVKTSTAVLAPATRANATVWRYTIQCIAEDPRVFTTADDLAVW